MENQPQPQVPITPLSLLTRQLTGWQNLLADLITANAPDDQRRYCRKRITALVAELKSLEDQ
ncbi:hypothetical protein [Spirosoma spitsbergense]|uniref:hypothetical protein n=1 Tax=Spirosoma spitsbergense TaxID=431554 RepID=UPI00035E0868|nr:hypothetical protein [Spirosoma spitsbergense]